MGKPATKRLRRAKQDEGYWRTVNAVRSIWQAHESQQRNSALQFYHAAQQWRRHFADWKDIPRAGIAERVRLLLKHARSYDATAVLP